MRWIPDSIFVADTVRHTVSAIVYIKARVAHMLTSESLPGLVLKGELE